jgi:hypothetical protein
MLTRVNPSLDRLIGPVILFQDAINILNGSVHTAFLLHPVGFELNVGWRISSVACRYRLRAVLDGLVSAHRFGEKTLRHGRNLLG